YPRQFRNWLEHLRDASFLPHVALALAVLVVVALCLAAVHRVRLSISDPRVVAAIACAVSLVLVVALFATQPNQEPRYLLPLIPLFGVLLALALAWSQVRLLLGVA